MFCNLRARSTIPQHPANLCHALMLHSWSNPLTLFATIEQIVTFLKIRGSTRSLEIIRDTGV